MPQESDSPKSGQPSKDSEAGISAEEESVVKTYVSLGPKIKKSLSKNVLLALVILFLSIGGVFAALSFKTKPKHQNIQFSTQYFTSGYVSYDASKLKTVETTLPEIVPVLKEAAHDGKSKQVIFLSDLANSPKRLVMYDVTEHKTYLVAEHNSIAGYYNPTIMGGHFVVFSESSQSDPLNSKTTIRMVNLKTGDTQTLMENKSSELPLNLCCSVSPDGLRLAIPQTDKFLVYRAGETKPVNYPTQIKIFPKVEGSDQDNYAASQRNAGYPKVVWLDNDRLMYAKSHPSSWVISSEGSQAARADNGLAIYNTKTRESKDVPRTFDAAIRWFTVDGQSLIFSDYNIVLNGLTIFRITDFESENSQSRSLLRTGDYQSRLFYDQASKKLYVQPSGASLDHDMSMVKQLDTVSGKTVDKKLSNFKFPNIEGVIGPDKLIINDSRGVNNDYNIYNVSDNTFQHLFSFTDNN